MVVLGGVEGTTASLPIFSSVLDIVVLAFQIMTCFNAANYICDMNGHSKELGTLELDFTEHAYCEFMGLNVIFLGKMPPDVHEFFIKMLN